MEHKPPPLHRDPSLPWYARPYVDLQYLLPHHLLSALMYRLTHSHWPLLKALLIRRVVDLYKVDMQQAQNPDLSSYASFNHFFTRALRTDARPLAEAEDAVLCPADGVLSQVGDIRDGRIFQAKGRDYSLLELIGGEPHWARHFEGGRFATIYLSPRDYHRVHMPLAADLVRMLHIPGRLFSVNPTTTRLVPRLFARNERVVSLFETSAGPMAVVMVGAIFVSGMDTVWAGTVTPTSKRVQSWDYGPRTERISLARGAEMGRFNMGSTVILLFTREQMQWSRQLSPGQAVKMGEQIGQTSG